MLVVLAGLAMAVLDGAIANIALPTIAAELRTDPANAVWVVNAYQLAVTVSLLPFASLGELRGYRRVFVWRALPQTPLARHRFDWLSALLSALTLGALIIGIDDLRRLTVAVALELAGAAVAGALFVWRQRLLAYPMLALELFARPVFALSVASSICSFTAQNLTFVSLPFFLEEVLGRSAVETGLLMTP
jgi:MFS family permease